MNFPGKRLRHFLNIPIIYHHAKNQKNLKSYSWEKYETDRRTDRQQWLYGTLRRAGVQYEWFELRYVMVHVISSWSFYVMLMSLHVMLYVIMCYVIVCYMSLYISLYMFSGYIIFQWGLDLYMPCYISCYIICHVMCILYVLHCKFYGIWEKRGVIPICFKNLSRNTLMGKYYD